MQNSLKAYLMYEFGDPAQYGNELFTFQGADFPLEIFLFSQYVPGDIDIYTKYERFNSPFTWNGVFRILEDMPTIIQGISNSDIIVPTKAALAPSELAFGETVTNGVEVFGSSVYCELEDNSITFNAAAVDPEVFIRVQAPGATVRTPVQVRGGDTNLNTVNLNMILKESDYTQAMADNDNIVEYVYPGVGTDIATARIVGLWEGTTAGSGWKG